MRTILFSKAMTLISMPLLAVMLSAQASDPLDKPHTQASDGTSVTATTATSTPGTSKVRIVRLSEVRGAVQIDRNIGRGFEPGITNLPVVEGSRIRTEVGVAEVEFEDNSSLRLAPNTTVNFPVLERSASGATLNEVRVEKGSAYISLVKPESKNAPVNQFLLRFGERKLNLDPATHVRLDVDAPNAKLAVLDGAVKVDSENGPLEVSKKRTATFALMDQAQQPAITKDVEKAAFDDWDHTASAYHATKASLSAFNSPYSYGVRDMMYYGNFVNAGGCGSMWRPYFASAAWDPYANGVWAWYPSGGYSWVSPYPWGWMPYHYGSWSYCPNVGWGWMPGGGWYGINNVAAVMPSSGGGLSAPAGGRIIQPPHAPVHPPMPHGPAMVAVSTKPLQRSEIASPGSFVFRKDSAGLGVPRESLGNLQKFSRDAVSRGSAQTPIYATIPQTGRAAGSPTMSQAIGASIHRGNPPAQPMPSQGSYGSGSYSRGMSGSSGGAPPSMPSPVISAPHASPAPSAPSSIHK